MRCKFPANDLMQRLDTTICRYDGIPVLVRVDGKRVQLFRISDTMNLFKQIKPDDEKFDISTPSLGYVQYLENKVCYVTRAPVRRYKQGIDERAMHYHFIDYNDGKRQRVSPFTKAFENMINGVYPRLNEAIKTLNKDSAYAEIAISREVAITKKQTGVMFVYYKNHEVGWIAPESKVVRVNPPNASLGWVVSKFLRDFDWEIV